MSFSVRFFTLSRTLLAGVCCASVGAGCSNQSFAPSLVPQTPAVEPGRTIVRHIIAASSSYQVLYNFSGNPDGAGPLYMNLIDVNGTLYGTTYGGGIYDGVGTVFSMSTSGSEQVLHSFGAAGDGIKPYAGVIDVKGTLYGTTYGGGPYPGQGTVFSITTSGEEHVLHTFCTGSGTAYCPDGAKPIASLIDVNGTLYGTTSSGGLSEYGGTVFSISTTGKHFRVLHAFNGFPDGRFPFASLIDVNGTLYGSTTGGGNPYINGGTVFSISTTGKGFRVLHTFGGYPDAQAPEASFIYVNGTLYGTTPVGGAYQLSTGRGGTVFSFTTAGKHYRVRHSFGAGRDGYSPDANLTDVNGVLYGTTAAGGTYGTSYGNGGTVFSISTAGTHYHVRHSFNANVYDGRGPSGGLIDVNGILYGATFAGGTKQNGTVFALRP